MLKKIIPANWTVFYHYDSGNYSLSICDKKTGYPNNYDLPKCLNSAWEYIHTAQWG